ncbi:MAG: alpha/beta hydrolase, partial [Bacteroidales bacterium]|nr:alpha/beta hydrolase [Bacteroidales bacterium]MDD4581900.1 alpha/beta hydrolase [Bacteroidales bacterium]
IIQGTTDIQVSVNDAQLLSAAKPDAECIIIKNMNHVLKKSSSALKENMDTYAKPELPLMKGLMKNIILFIENH